MRSELPPTVDPAAAAAWALRAPAISPWLHEEVARRMAERLAWIRHKPAAWSDWSAVRGGLRGHATVARHYPQARAYVVEQTPHHLAMARQALGNAWWDPRSWRHEPVSFGPPPEGGVDMVWANMGLHSAADPYSLITQWQRALAPQGFVMFSCLGPDSLRELRTAYAAQGWPAPGQDFTDMHDWGDMLVTAGFAEPVMDTERITLSFVTPERLLQELRELGRNLHPQRFSALRGRAWHRQLVSVLQQLALPGQAPAGTLTLSFEIIYGHAFKAAPRVKVSEHSAVSLQDMRTMLQSGR